MASAASGTRKCYVCKQSGHMSKDCPQASGAAKPAAPKPAPAAAPSSSSSDASGSNRKCYHCGLGGHMAKDCSEAPKDGARKKSAGGKDDKGFKERLAEFKAQNPAEAGKPKPAFCYLCGQPGHRERDCDRNSKKKEDKACLKCGDEGHIARYCPTIQNRTKFRNEDKERAKGCYVCSEEGHHATECPKLDELQEEFYKLVAKLQSGLKLHIKVYNILLEKCAKALELNGALFLYESLRARGVEATEDTWRHLEYLHDRSGKDQSKITGIPMQPKRVAKLKDILTAYRHQRRVDDIAQGVLGHVATFLRSNLEAAQAHNSLFELATYLRKQSIPQLDAPLSSAAARAALTSLKGLGRYHQKNKGAEFDLGDAKTDLRTPGKFAKKEDEQAASNKKGSKKSKKKTTKKKKASTDEKDSGVNGESKEKKKGGAKRKQSEQDTTDSKPAAKKAKASASAQSEEEGDKSSSSQKKQKKQKSNDGAAVSTKKDKKSKAAAAEEEEAPVSKDKSKKRKSKA